MRESAQPQGFASWHAADLADHLERLPVEEARRLLGVLPPGQAAAVLTEIKPEAVPELIGQIPPQKIGELVGRIAPQEAADLLQILAPGLRRAILDALTVESTARIQALLRYPTDTAGGIMSDRFIALGDWLTVDQARESLRAQAQEDPNQSMVYLYVTDSSQKLVGVARWRDLVFRRGDQHMGEIMNREVKRAGFDTDQEELARLFEHYHYLELPVTDAEGRLVGVVKACDAMEIAREEATEDMQLMVGLSGEERALTPWRKSAGRRLPWLCFNLATAFAAAAVVNFYENTIAEWTALAVFLPIIAGLGGNAGMQTLTVIIRDLALGELSPGEGRKALLKELVLGAINGLAIGVVVGVGGYLWKGEAILGLVVGMAMFLNQVAAALSGVVIPLGLKLFRVDPALASSIFLTAVTDVAGFFFFLGLASLALRSGLP